MDIPQDVYTDEQKKAWAGAVSLNESLSGRLLNGFTLLALEEGQVIAMASLAGGECIDFLYVRPDDQRTGTASILLEQLEREAESMGAVRLHTEASFAAVPFFMKHGYEKVRHQEKTLNGTVIKNVRMCKKVHI
nr:GNAT family N-acetyltransferase [Halobacillus kuroshimensis]